MAQVRNACDIAEIKYQSTTHTQLCLYLTRAAVTRSLLSMLFWQEHSDKRWRRKESARHDLGWEDTTNGES